MFKRIVLISNSDTKEVAETLENLIVYLQSNAIECILDEDSAALTNQQNLPVIGKHKSDANYDLVIAIGGDGTMLKASHFACLYETPLLGINKGHLGFLTDIPANLVEKHLNAIFAGSFIEDERLLLQVELLREGESLIKSNALNDVVLQRWNIARPIEFEAYVNGSFVYRQRSDGLIVTSPTGSTGYALSGGGPILHPALDALALVPICPHTLTNRPIVVDGNSLIEIVVKTYKNDHARLTCDGEVKAELAPKDRIRIQKKEQKITLIHPQGHDHFSTLRSKLQWGA